MANLDMDALSPAQREVFEQICCGNDVGHPPATLTALERRELIVGYPDELPGWPPVQVTRWDVPLDVHMQWAAWCAAQPAEEETLGDHRVSYPPLRLLRAPETRPGGAKRR